MALDTGTRNLAVAALAIVSLAVIVGVGSIVLAEMQPASWQTSDVQEESNQPATPFPTNYTVAQQSSDADFEELNSEDVVVIFEDSDAGANTTLAESTDYNVYESAGNIELLNSTDTSDYDSASDTFYYEYTYEYSGDATSILGTGLSALQSFADFFTVIVVIAVAVVLFGLLRVVRGAGRGVTA